MHRSPETRTITVMGISADFSGEIASAAIDGDRDDLRGIRSHRAGTTRTSAEILDAAQRLLAFRLTSQTLRGSRTLLNWPDMTDPTKRFDLLFGSIHALSSQLTKEGVDTANMLLFDGFAGPCEELIHTAQLLSR